MIWNLEWTGQIECFFFLGKTLTGISFDLRKIIKMTEDRINIEVEIYFLKKIIFFNFFIRRVYFKKEIFI